MPHAQLVAGDRSVLHLARAGLALVLCATGLVGCGSGGGGRGAVGSVAARAERAPIDHEAYARIGYRIEWRGFPVMTQNAHVAQFDVLGDALVVQDSANTFTAMETGSGRNRWSNQLATPLTRFVGNVRVDNHLLASSDSELYVLDMQTGAQLDRQHLAVLVNTKPLVSKDVAVYGGASGEVLGHSLVTTFKKWGYMLGGSIDARPAAVGDLVGVVSQTGDVIILDPSTGSSTGRGRVFAGLANNPVGSPSALYVASLDQSVYAFGAYGGERLWRHRVEQPITDQPTLDGDRLYVAIPGAGLLAFNAASGEVLWTATGVRGSVVAERDKRLVVWDGSQAILIDPETGDVLDRVKLPGVARVAFDAFKDGNLFTTTSDGVVSKFTPRQ